MRSDKPKLFVIIDPTSEHQPALVKAELIAKLGECHIHAFLCVHGEAEGSSEAVSRRDYKHQTIKRMRSWLEELMQASKLVGVSYSTEIVWNERWYETALHSIAKSGCDLVIKSSFHHSRERRFFTNTSDHSLMCFSPCPVLFTHESQAWESNRILACVDLESKDQRHRRLNSVIVRNARVLSKIVGMELSIVSVYRDQINRKDLPISHDGTDNLEQALANLYGVEEENVILREGDAVEGLGLICGLLNPAIVIMGTMARSGVIGKLVGNTAEKMLDVIDADLLAVS